MFKLLNRLSFYLGILLVVGGVGWYGISAIFGSKTPTTPTTVVTVQPTTVYVISYPGKTGKDALTLLKEQTTVVQNTSGLVTTINGRKADEKNREYWSFYVNGKMAAVGPAAYKTKDTDKIEWKIEKY